MGAGIEIITGPAGSGKTQRCLAAYREAIGSALGSGKPAPVLWIAPTELARRQILETLTDADAPVAFSPNVTTFASFAERILQSAGTSLHNLDPATQRRLLRRLIDEQRAAGRLKHFRPIADSAGFLDLVQSLIAELKRAEVWPEEFATVFGRVGGRAKHVELSQLYRRYQELLQERQLYDNEGRFWSARDEIANNGLGPFSQRELVVLEGFTDFTRTQHDILRALAGDARRLMITLPLETPLQRTELFAKTAAVRERLADEFGHSPRVTDVRLGDRAPSQPPGFHVIAAALFADSDETDPASDSTGITVLAANGATTEVDVVSQRVKSLLLDGVDPGGIVVAFRTLDGVADLVRSRFAAAGIPVWCEAGQPLLHSPMLRALFEVLRLELEDWPFERLKAVLHSSYFHPTWGGAALDSRIRRLLRMLRKEKLHSQRRIMVKVLQRRVDRKTGDPETMDEAEEIAAAYDILKRLSDATQPLRKKADFTGWVTRLIQLGRELGMAPRDQAAAGGTDARLAERDRQTWERFDRVLFAAAKADEIATGKHPKLTLSEFLSSCEELLKTQEAPPTDDPRGCVRVLAAQHVRGLDVDHLFLAGLTEQSFPQLRRDDCLYLASERAELREQGLQIGHAAERRQEEMLLFYGIVTRARQSLTLSYPAIGANGEPLFCSPFLSGLLALFPVGSLPVQSCGSLDPVPSIEQIVSAADWRCAAIAELRDGRAESFHTLAVQKRFAPAAAHILAATDANVARFESPGWTRYEGIIRDDQLRKRLAARFPADHQFSATQLERYATCRFRFFLSDIVKIEPLEPPTTATDYRGRGVIFHDVLAAVHRRLSGDEEEDDAWSPEALIKEFHDNVERELGRRPTATELATALAEVERRLFADWSEAYAEQWTEYRQSVAEVWNAAPRAAHLELPFGEVPGPEEDEPTYPSLEFGTGPNRTRIRGRIDRVDVGTSEGQTVFTVVDYKTGRPPRFSEHEVRSGKAIQLVLYTLAVKRLAIVADDAAVFQFGYWHIRETGFVPGLKGSRQVDTAIDSAVLQSLEELLDALIPWLADGIRGGHFPVDSDDLNCITFCPYRTACRITQITPLREALQKTRDPGPVADLPGAATQ